MVLSILVLPLSGLVLNHASLRPCSADTRTSMPLMQTGKSALYIAIGNGDTKSVKMLVAAGASVETRNQKYVE